VASPSSPFAAIDDVDAVEVSASREQAGLDRVGGVVLGGEQQDIGRATRPRSSARRPAGLC